MKKIVRLTESDLVRLVKRVIMEDDANSTEKKELYLFLTYILNHHLYDGTGWIPDPEGKGIKLTEKLLGQTYYRQYEKNSDEPKINPGEPLSWKLIPKLSEKKIAWTKESVYCYVTGEPNSLEIILEKGDNSEAQSVTGRFSLKTEGINKVAYDALEKLWDIYAK